MVSISIFRVVKPPPPSQENRTFSSPQEEIPYTLAVSFLPTLVQPKAAAAAAKSLQSCPTLCDPIDGSPQGSSVPGILQARTLE